ncbi:MAG: membrane protein [Roseibaca calidilacus]|uniref:Membrane protein n=1 Tax=Roseibaca calidilacus TaxID=1666912 RepID=A0A0P7W1X5_9RHOB|nr:hypothetical protein [Roseibaca calidilacus]KPP89884.1 MAG: membrane protein [Roseibaca calidilacus]CUX80934.1 hypothetical protein Ga0058931_1423 [Roseibaca calidilacus]
MKTKPPIDVVVLRGLLFVALTGLAIVGVAMAMTDSTRVLRTTPPPEYELHLSEDGTSFRFTGLVDFGLTRDLRLLAQEHPEVKQLILDSRGGYIAEARGAVTVLQSQGIATHVERHCASACALIFAGGTARSLTPDARIGLHGYALRPDNMYFGMIDPRREMARDMDIYRAQQIAEPFVQKLAGLPQAPMWYPDHAALRSAGFVTLP